jgi:23S rRNA G2069 N7-methylase RlmK/C1962 C5-methylase RlmI
MVKRVAHEEKRGLRQVALLGQSSDHPIDLFFPESEYLTGLLLEVE